MAQADESAHTKRSHGAAKDEESDQRLMEKSMVSDVPMSLLRRFFNYGLLGQILLSLECGGPNDSNQGPAIIPSGPRRCKVTMNMATVLRFCHVDCTVHIRPGGQDWVQSKRQRCSYGTSQARQIILSTMGQRYGRCGCRSRTNSDLCWYRA